MKNSSRKGTFSFESYELNPETKEARFNYKLTIPGKEYLFTERLIFPKDLKWQKVPAAALDSAMQAIHLIAGISYWKAYCSKKIEVKDMALSKAQAVFWNKVYTKGLGEFFYKNKIDFRSLVHFPSAPSIPKLKAKSYKLKAETKALLLFGGGKDSLVSAELLRKIKKKFDFFYVASGKESDVIMSMLPGSAVIVKRQIDPQIVELNSRGAYNGHIPITALINFVAELTAILYGYRYVISSNERSADYGNMEYLGETINHQWSKSLEFEEMFQGYANKFITPSITYFSLLRPFYEIKILELFSRLGKKYFRKFSSCNHNFKVFKQRLGEGRPSFAKASEGKLSTVWCGHCPKCAFVFAMLSVFVPKKELVSIFGKNLFADKALLPLYRELLGVAKFKPFECVGTPEEVIYAFAAALASGKYDGDAAIEMFLKEVSMSEREFGGIEKNLFSNGKHLIPKEFIGVIANNANKD